LQAQAPVPPFVGLWTRLAGFDQAELQRLIDERRIVRATMMRHTIHFVRADDYVWLRPTIQPALDAGFGAQTRKRLAGFDIEPLLAAARKQFAARPLTFAEVKELIRSLAPGSDVDAVAYGVRSYVELIGVPNDSRWRFGGRAPFVLAEDWLGRPLGQPDAPEMVRRYLAAFGPATPADATAWSGVGGMRAVFESMRDELRTFRDEAGRELFDVDDAPLPDEDVEVPVRFLPEYDNTLLGHKDRTRVIADEHRPLVYLTAGRMIGTVLVDGFVAAGWRITDGELALEPFRTLTKAEKAAVEPEAETLREWLRG
ncbi:MAG TPA: winged helix DNA-binding domain-containing protein, partial [Thermoleophilaceae bacterium]